MSSGAVNHVLYQISNAVSTTGDLNELYRKIHTSLEGILDVTNFYIALYDAELGAIYFPYFRDQMFEGESFYKFNIKDHPGTLTYLVIQKGEAIALNRQQITDHYNKFGKNHPGPISEIWIGIPLVVKKEVIGAIVLQSYSDPDCYSEKDLKLLSSVSDQIATAIDRKRNQAKIQNLVENIKDVVYTTNSSGMLTYVSPIVKQATGYDASELVGLAHWKSSNSKELEFCKLIHPEDEEFVHQTILEAFQWHSSFEIEYRIFRKDGSLSWVLDRGQFFKDESGMIYLEGLISDINQIKRVEQINRAIFNISNAVNTTHNFDELFLRINESVKTIIHSDHFGIGLYDREKDTISFTHNHLEVNIEHPDIVFNASKSPSLNAEVINRQKPVTFSREEMVNFAASKGGRVLGTISESWLGVPLFVKGEIIGTMFTETLDPSKVYTQADIDCFVTVSDQIALAIERKRNEDQIRFREKLITTLYHISNSIHNTSSLDQLYHSIHEALVPIINVDNFTIALYDESKDTLNFRFTSDKTDPDILEPISGASKTDSLTYHVIETKKSLLLKEGERKKLQKNTGGRAVGKYPSKSWLGVPLKGKTSILGVIINQSYVDINCYRKEDISLLEAISDQVAFAIEYKRAEADLHSAQDELLEKAHKAGMADIAADTIHNLGNILNSVKTSNELMHNVIRQSAMSGLKKATGLLKDKMDHLHDFILYDPNGEKLMEYFISLEESLKNELTTIQDQSERVADKIDLMTNVIRTQQNYLYDGSVEEECPIDKVVNSILDMYKDSFNNAGIELIRKFKDRPKTLVQKTKFTHILLNLIDNAKDAMSRSSNYRVLTVSLWQETKDVWLEFKDTGEGIAKHHLDKVFAHGFTTKSHGHGFGLHNCANLATEMDGTLLVKSEGPGHGARFLLRIPKK